MSKLISKISAVIIIASLIVFGFTQIRSCSHNKEVLSDVKENITLDTVKYWYDKDSIEHATTKEIIVDVDAANILFKTKIDSLKRLLHLKDKQIKDILSTKISFKDHIDAVIDTDFLVKTDSNGFTLETTIVGFHYDDSIVKVDGTIDSMVHLDCEIKNIPLVVTGYWKRKWFLGKKHYFIDAYSENKNVHIKQLMKISMKKK